MVLSDRDIKRYITAGKIKISPEPDYDTQLGSCSVDLRLGDTFMVFEHSRFAFIDLRASADLTEIMREIKIGQDEPFVLQPRQFVLATTLESLELDTDILARLEGRSSLGRIGIIVHGTSSVFDPGWQGNATLELGNLGIMPVALYMGMKICSFTFEQLSSPVDTPYFAKKGQKYTGQTKPLPSRIQDEVRGIK
jgi:dCTP deaminase